MSLGPGGKLAAGVVSLLVIITACGGEGSAPLSMSLKDLGFSHVEVPLHEEGRSLGPRLERWGASVPISLPEGAQQGPEDWWLLYTHFLVEFDEDTGPGNVTINAGINGRTAIQLIITSHGHGKGFTASQLELVTGWTETFTLAPQQTYAIANYSQKAGIIPGPGRLSFGLRKTNEVRVKRLVFFDDTKLIRIPLGTPRLQIDASLPKEAMVVGREVPLSVHLSSSRWPVKSASIRVVDPDEAFEIERPPDEGVKTLSGTHTLLYRITPVKSGEHPLFFRASTRNAGNPQARFDAMVYERGEAPSESWQRPWMWGIVAVAMAAIVIGILIYYAVRGRFRPWLRLR